MLQTLEFQKYVVILCLRHNWSNCEFKPLLLRTTLHLHIVNNNPVFLIADSRTTTAVVTTITEETKTEISSQSIITAPITPQNNVTVIYSTVTTTVNVTVTEVTTVYVSEHVTPAPTSSTCWTASSLGVTSAASTSRHTTKWLNISVLCKQLEYTSGSSLNYCTNIK